MGQAKLRKTEIDALKAKGKPERFIDFSDDPYTPNREFNHLMPEANPEAAASSGYAHLPHGMSNQLKGVCNVCLYLPGSNEPVFSLNTSVGWTYMMAKRVFGTANTKEVVVNLDLPDGGLIQFGWIYQNEFNPDDFIKFTQHAASMYNAYVEDKIGGRGVESTMTVERRQVGLVPVRLSPILAMQAA